MNMQIYFKEVEMKDFRLPEEIKAVMSRLNACGFCADLVGGAVRDFLLGKEPFDYDITTDATPDEMKRVFSGMRVVETGIKHGTLTVIVNSVPIEVTTYRIDGEYSDARHPEDVSFTKNLADDLSRRDFTVNAIAYSEERGITDLFGGMKDLEDGCIRAVGDAYLRFTEDALRIMRALRFSSTLGFKIEKSTADAIFEKAHLLKLVSVERIYAEWQKLVTGRGVFEVISRFYEPLSVVLPEISPSLSVKRWDAYFAADARLASLALFSHLSGDEYSSLMYRMHSDAKSRTLGERVLSAYRTLEVTGYVAIKRIASSLGYEVAESALRLRYILGIDEEEPLLHLSRLKESGEAYEISQLKIGGEELMALGVRGQAIGEWLSRLLSSVIEGEISNERDALISFVAKNT
ncbi:MAG: CCA tRNA nucleotidyltransferase [Clostridia bacterium]|nr:CCA tRNA nucleotidyltransferase [Clostridia bacterium]